MTIIEEAYKNYKPPKSVKRSVCRLLNGIDQKKLVGLHSVVLTNSGALNHKKRRHRTKYKKKRISLTNCNGWYQAKWKSERAHIELLVDNILSSWPGWFPYFSFLTDLALSKTLYHEIGHHIHITKVPEFKECENVADKWMLRLSKKYFWRNYWYILGALYPIKGIIDWAAQKVEGKNKN